MVILSRREFLRDSTRLAAGLGVFSSSRKLLAQEPHWGFPTAPRDRLAVTSYPFRAFIESPTNRARDPKKPGMDLKEFAAMAAQRFGIHNINPLGGHLRSTDPQYLEEFREAIEKMGSHLVDLGLGDFSFYDPDSAKRQATVEKGKKWIDIAAALGSPSIRPHIGGPHNAPPDVDRAAETLGRLADYGAAKHIVVNLENDDPVSEDPFFIVKVIEKVQNPYLRSLPDFGNSAADGGPEFNQRAVRAMLTHAFNMAHVKDSVRDRHGKVCTVELDKLFPIAKASGYRGYYSMEFDTAEGDPYEGTERLGKETLGYLSA